MKQAFYIAVEVWEELASIDIGIGYQSYSENFISDLVIVAADEAEACQIFLDWVNDNRDPYYGEMTSDEITHKIFLCEVIDGYKTGIAQCESAWLWHLAQCREEIDWYVRFWAGREDNPRIDPERKSNRIDINRPSFAYHGWYENPTSWYHLADLYVEHARRQKWVEEHTVEDIPY
jgi:hypothetical protein